MRFKCSIALILFSIFSIPGGARCEDKPQAGDDDKKRAAALIKDLGADDFEARENAEKGLIALGAAAVAQLKDAVAGTADAEVRSRGERILKALALETETDPERLAAMAKSDAEAHHFAEASKLYAKAGKLFKEAAEKAADAKQKKELEGKSTKALERQQRATAFASAEGGDQNMQRIVINGRVRFIQNGGVMINAMGGDNDSASDW